MSDNEELILGLCRLPEAQENTPESNGAVSTSPQVESETETGELITGDVGDFKPHQDLQDSHNNVEFRTVIQGQSGSVEYKPNVPCQPDPQGGVIIKKEEVIEESDALGSNDLSNSNAAVEAEPERVTVSSSIVDFINQAGAEFTADTTLDEDESESSSLTNLYRPVKKKRKTLPKGNLQCAECRTQCDDFESYSNHMSTHSEIPLYTCPKCLYIFEDESLYEAHTAQTCKAAGNSKDKECAVCKKSFKYDSHLREHIICMHNKTPMFSCPICAQNITSWRRSIDRHMANHATNNKCPSCGLKGDGVDAVDAHIAEVGANHLRCKSCDFVCSFRVDFFNHVNVHIPKVDVLEPMVCYKCSHRFQRTSEFNNHIRFFCQYRDVDVSKIEAVKASEAPPPTIQLPLPESVNHMQEHNPQVLQIANDPTKQVISLPEGVNNNAFIPITVSTGNDEHGQGTTVILIPQFLLMPNAGLVAPDGSQQEVVSTGQNDQVIYLECVKPEQPQGMISMFEMPTDKSGQENIYPNHLSQTILQAVQPMQGLQTIQTMQPLQVMDPTQAGQHVQHVQLQAVQQVQQALQSLQAVEPVQTIQPLHTVHTMQASEQPPVSTVKEEPPEEVEETSKPDVNPPASVESSSAPPLSVQNVFSLSMTPTSSAAPVESGSQQIDSGGPPPPALVCSVCHEVLKDSEMFESHVKQHDKAKPKLKPNVVVPRKTSSAFKCEECGQGFAAKHHLEQHTITFHSDVAGIVCPVCRVGMASEKTSLNEHLAKAHKLRVEPSGKLTECSDC